MFVCCECRVLSSRGLCDELITRPKESYRLWCVVVCNLENLKNEDAMTRVGSQRHKKKYCLQHVFIIRKTVQAALWYFIVHLYKQYVVTVSATHIAKKIWKNCAN